MTAIQHSPGPWIATRRTSRVPFDYHITQDWPTGSHIVTVHDEGGGRVHGDNARLIAAAPDMLDALEEIEGLPCDDNGDRIIPAGFLDNARQAIAKARGQA